jgi:NTE family protein
MADLERKRASRALKRVEMPPYDVVALVLQGGGALGAYQAGVYEGLHEAGIRPTWLAGISIGALNAAVIAGSPETERVDRLRQFWETICAASVDWPTTEGLATAMPFAFDLRSARNSAAAMRALLQGQRGFFKPRFPPPFLSLFTGDAATSFYDTTPLRETLERLVDFDRLNSGDVRVSVAAVNVRTGNLVYFDTAERRLRPEHFMASGALPPGFPPIEVDGEYYWDGGMVSNTPLSRVLSSEPRRDTLTFQVDLWSAKGRKRPAARRLAGGVEPAEGHPVFQPDSRHHLSHAADAENAPGVAAIDGEAAGGGEERPGRRGHRRSGLPPGLQHYPSDLPVQGLRRPFQGLRVRTGCDARTLAERSR